MPVPTPIVERSSPREDHESLAYAPPARVLAGPQPVQQMLHGLFFGLGFSVAFFVVLTLWMEFMARAVARQLGF